MANLRVSSDVDSLMQAADVAGMKTVLSYVWGDIGGTLANQTDLFNALSTAAITGGTITGIVTNPNTTIFAGAGGGSPVLKVDAAGNLLICETGVGAIVISIDTNGNPVLTNKTQTHSISVDGSGVRIDGSLTPVFLVDDSGWSANADSGDKTQSIPSSATLATMQAALNLVASGAGDALLATAQKCKALETALNAALLPNA